MNQNIKEIYNKNIQLLRDIDKIIYYFRIQNFDYALRITTHIISQISSYIELLIQNENYFNESNRLIDSQELLAMFRDLLIAQENKDYILLADLYELSFLPFLIKLQEEIIGKEEYSFDKENYKKTIERIEQSDKELARLLKAMPGPDILPEQGYGIEYTSGGLMTLASMDNGKKFYFHSNSRVQKEAFTLAESWYKEEVSEYIVYGLGLGYHLLELITIDSNINLEIYESDLNIIRLACAFSSVFTELISHPKVRLVYDPDFLKLSGRLVNVEADTEFYVHYPSLRNIKNASMKEKLENYFIQYSSVKNQLHLLNGNFHENRNHYDDMVDHLKDQFQGKDLYIVAAGPSLDHNFMQLKEVGDKGIILATGTVFRKLLNAGIPVDYVIVTDANPRVYGQIAGLEEVMVPMLYLSTAYQGFAACYKGKKYMICQKDFNVAEEFAEEHGYHLFKTGGSVSTTALDIGIYFKCRRIIFLGLDLAFTNNFVHASGTSRRNLTETDDLRQVEDINGQLIYTSRSLDMYRQWIEKRIQDVGDIEFIDASEGGAKIKGMKIAKLNDILKAD